MIDAHHPAMNTVGRRDRRTDFFLIFSFFIAMAFVFLRGQDRNWDLLNYHFYQGYALLHGRTTSDVAAAGLQSFLNPMVNVVSYVLLKEVPFPISAWVILVIQFSSVPAVLKLAKEIGADLGGGSDDAIFFATALCLVSPVWASELGTSFFSSWTAPLILWAVYLLYAPTKPEMVAGWRVAASGAMLGLATGLKLTNAPFSIAAFMMVAVLHGRGRLRFAMTLGFLLLVSWGLGFAVTAWWNYHLLRLWGSPFFPFYNAIFRSDYFDFVNFRDFRWVFSSVSDFLSFCAKAAVGTNKTSEIEFSDLRYLIILILAPVSCLRMDFFSIGRRLFAFIVFGVVAGLLWAVMFAYQRYLIPIELILGLFIWILVARIFHSRIVQKIIVGAIAAVSLIVVGVPDWGHAPAAFAEKNPFGIEMSPVISATPARYVVVGNPISYVLPYLHPKSYFFGVGLSSQLDELILKRVSERSELPLRILAKDSDAYLMHARLQSFGYNPANDSLACELFRTGVDRYMSCEVLFEKKWAVKDGVFVSADFFDARRGGFSGILWQRGLSAPEKWGSWSEGKRVELGLASCLPAGRYRFSVVGHAFQRNAGLPTRFSIGETSGVVVFKESDGRYDFDFMISTGCADRIFIDIPSPVSPMELKLSPDSRNLGVGLVSLRIVKEKI